MSGPRHPAALVQRSRDPSEATLSTATDSTAQPATDVEPLVISPTGLDPRALDQDAVRAVQRLQERGHEAYLVGGCVRDLLLGQSPKDFDIATSARPQVIKRLFPRNCRIIGRRFKLAHLHFDRNTKILEVSTFRRAPQVGALPVGAPQDADDDAGEDLLITRDNEFGNAQEDALRRDFTINSLFFDPVRDELIDHTNGLADVESRTIRTIGDPEVRFREDPVRILRAIKFAGRLGLSIEPRTAAAMRAVAPDLVRSAPPRMLEEVLRLLRGGHALDAFQRMREIGALRAIMPTLDAFLDRAPRERRVRFWRLLEALDGRRTTALRGSDGGRPRTATPPRRAAAWPPDNGVLLAALFLEPVDFAASGDEERSPTTLAEELVAPFANDFRLPRRDAGCLKRICAVHHRFLGGVDGERQARVERFLRDPFFAEALALFELATTAHGGSLELLDRWRERERRHLGLAEATPQPRVAAAAPQAHAHPRTADATGRDAPGRDEAGGRRKRRRKRRGEGDGAVLEEPRRQATVADDAASDRAVDEPARRDRDDDRKARHRDRERDRDRDKKARKKGKERDRKERDRKQRKDKRKGREDAHVETIEPESIDVSAFDVELDPKRVPTFGTIVEGQQKRRRPRPLSPEDDDYRPPPVDGPDAGPPPPPRPHTHDGGVFGDW
ncbi:MAG: polynucleotide adenylyltransferase PcnB [Planctomycetes bacterium]|nr:polynucleotide adenylyltransferase PcnB [Planctomycetota bacterium]